MNARRCLHWLVAGCLGQTVLADVASVEQALREGRFRDAQATLDSLQPGSVTPMNQAALQADIHIAQGHPNLARDELESALARQDSGDGRAQLLIRMGLADVAMGNQDTAVRNFDTAAQVAQNNTLVVFALANAARSLREEAPLAAQDRVARALTLISNQSRTTQWVELVINLSATLMRLQPDAEARAAAYKLLDAARKAAQANGSARLEALVLAQLGRLYEMEGRPGEALQLYDRGVQLAQTGAADDVLYQLEWGRARALEMSGEMGDAAEAWQRAVDTLETLKYQVPFAFAAGTSHFAEQIEPVYYGLVAAHLRQPRSQQSLSAARDTMEQLKVAELRNFFGDDCVDRAVTTLSAAQVSHDALVVYPIPLPDRLVLLAAGSDGNIMQREARVSAEELKSQLLEFRRLVEKRTTREFLRPARRLYDWLVRPVLADAGEVSTLVYVPHDTLNTIPIAALHDGERYLVDRFAVAITPSMQLTEPRPLAGADLKVLIAGVSEAVQSYPALAHVPTEVAEVAAVTDAQTLLNAEFGVEELTATLAAEPFSVVHLATHGEFAGGSNSSFLLTHDEQIGMDRLEDYVGLFRFRTQPLELLTLSACDTAAGDARSALGLSGVAVKSGARSALGSLWRVNDEAGASLIQAFYQRLSGAGDSRAQALRRAQLTVKQDPRYWHPGYWAPYTLISNWL